MARENVFTGKTDTVGNVGSSKVSAFGSNLFKGATKISKFTKPI
jgi:hypothetical protein